MNIEILQNAQFQLNQIITTSNDNFIRLGNLLVFLRLTCFSQNLGEKNAVVAFQLKYLSFNIYISSEWMRSFDQNQNNGLCFQVKPLQ